MVSEAWLFVSPKELPEHAHTCLNMHIPTCLNMPGGEGLHPPIGNTLHCWSAQN